VIDFNPNSYQWAPSVAELLVDDFNKSLAFYCLLGFVDIYQRENFAYLDYQGAQLMIYKRDGEWEDFYYGATLWSWC
jgi:catechol 2,3-dioxygenase-like lactoylglutathione lyase family enzyme